MASIQQCPLPIYRLGEDRSAAFDFADDMFVESKSIVKHQFTWACRKFLALMARQA
jgi:hypothetical protein